MPSHPDQSAARAHAPVPSWRSLLALGVCLAVVTTGGALVLAGRSPASTSQAATLAAATTGTAPTPTTPWLPTTARVSTFNLLGYGHTMAGGDRKGWLDGRTRQSRADQIIRANNLQIIGFQEMEQPQIDVFNAEMSATFDLWPGNAYPGTMKTGVSGATVNVRGNSIAWRKDLWTAVEKTYYDAPYFEGKNVVKPIVLLQNKATGQRVYVTNTHNPANTKGNAQNYRNQSVDVQARTFNALRAAHPTTPIIFTGDMNDRTNFYCRFTSKTAMRAVNGGTRTSTRCTAPKSPQIDWIMSTTDVQWNGYQAVRTAYVKETTDHPVVWADATFKAPAAFAAGIKRVVVIDVEGLPSSALTRTGELPHLTAMRKAGVSTLNARTAVETSASLPNTLSILSGRPVAKASGGHGVSFSKLKARARYRTVKSATGSYVSTVIDTVHNQGGSTSFMSTDPNAAIVIRSAKAGLTDSQGVDYGKNKLTVSSLRTKDSDAIAVLKRQLRSHPRTFSYVQLTNPRVVGEKSGFTSASHRAAVRLLDQRVGQVLKVIRTTPALAGSTAVVLTSSSGGSGHSASGTAVGNYQVPLVAWGRGITAGDLYTLNPTFTEPGTARPSYSGSQPFRTANVANVVTTLLGYPAMPTPTSYGRAVRLFH